MIILHYNETRRIKPTWELVWTTIHYRLTWMGCHLNGPYILGKEIRSNKKSEIEIKRGFTQSYTSTTIHCHLGQRIDDVKKSHFILS